MDATHSPTRRVVYAATIAALYATATIVLAPISFGPLQFRAANLLMALMFLGPDLCFGLALGVFFGNLASPFGPLDWGVMPVVTLGASLLAYRIRKAWLGGIVAWAVITSLGVAMFPLGIGAQLPMATTWPLVFVAQMIVGCLGWVMFRPFSKILTEKVRQQ